MVTLPYFWSELTLVKTELGIGNELGERCLSDGPSL